MSFPQYFASRAAALSLALAIAACGGDQKQPTAADAKSPDKSAPLVAKDPPPADKVKVVDGPAPGDDRYTLRVEPAAEVKAGQEGTVKVTVVPKEPWHMNLDYPTSLALAAPEGVTLAKAEYAKADATKLDEKSAEFGLKFTARDPGDKAFTGKFKFAVCQDEACVPVTEDLSFRVAVK
jgi:hypothetical protein